MNRSGVLKQAFSSGLGICGFYSSFRKRSIGNKKPVTSTGFSLRYLSSIFEAITSL